MPELAKVFDPKAVDKKWATFWEEKGLFKADPSSKKPPFSVVIPPPNVTGQLHMGHALGMTIEDAVVRWKRMLGYETLWVPGTDHAGISTQTVVEKHLIRTYGKRRVEFSRDEFLNHVWEWKEKNEGKIIGQLKALGCSCDWSRTRFTMDEGNNRAVRTIFKKLYEEGLIYRGDYLVNWDTETETAIADDEVEYEERNSFLWTLKYPLKMGGFLSIATTRPETMLGDTAVAVHPEDPKYKHLIGTFAHLPLMNREIPIIADHRVDPEFGTGMVKVTPAHDPNDYQMGLTHNLPFINILTKDGKINENGGRFEGLTIKEAREKVVEALKELDLVEKIEPHVHRVGLSYRSKAVVEPYLSKQWFVRMDGFKQKLLRAVQEDHVSLVPPSWKNTYFHWIENLRDWCISRQLWWGHQIPIWYKKDDPDTTLCYDGEGLPPEVEREPDLWVQDPDVLDTWFSSALWPFATLGWPDKTPLLDRFYPNSVMICGHDILFFWVARMLVMGEFALEKLPFPEVYLTSLIFGKSYWRDNPSGGITYLSEEERRELDLGKAVPKGVHSKWEKMSKSKGNIIDPLEMIDEYGTDAVRMALLASATYAWELDLDRRRFEEFKNFANKVWNGARFCFMNLEDLTKEDVVKGIDPSSLSLEDRWILALFNSTALTVNQALKEFRFDLAATAAYEFFWNDFCAWYVEASKPVLFGKVGGEHEKKTKQKLLLILLVQAIRLLHPMAPFITEELFELARGAYGDMSSNGDALTSELLEALQMPSCALSRYPEALPQEFVDESSLREFGQIRDVVYQVRNIRGEMNIAPGVALEVHLVGAGDVVKKNGRLIEALVRIEKLMFHEICPSFEFASKAHVNGMEVLIPMPEALLVQERERQKKEREKGLLKIEQLEGQLGNLEFIERAPKALVEKVRAELEALRGRFG